MNTHLQNLTKRYPELIECIPQIEAAFYMLRDCYSGQGKLLVAGNGGSAADSDHIVGELMKGFLKKRKVPQQFYDSFSQLFPNEALVCEALQGALPAISLVSQSALITAYANDISSDMVFAQQVYGYGNQGDIFLGISTSGNSINIVHAMQVAKAKGLKTIGLTGKSGGAMKDIGDITISVPYDKTYEVQECHLPIYHTLCIMLEEDFFNE